MNKHITTLDLPSLQRVAFGFDDIFNDIGRNFANSVANTYPPYNIIRTDETHYAIEVAVAGFKEDEITVDLKDGILSIIGEVKTRLTNSSEQYLFRGISGRHFSRTFTLAEKIEVLDAVVKNGILKITLEQVVPVEQEPTKIKVTFQK